MSMDRERYNLLLEIQAMEFAALELNLYLDTHPEDERALREYNTYVRQLSRLQTQYGAKYGPLKNFGECPSQYPWRWIEEPWPWNM